MKRHAAIAILLVLVAGLYGYLGALINQNPYSPETSQARDDSKEQRFSWAPSIIWLPSYLACQFQIGVYYGKLGYGLSSDSDRHFYIAASTLGGILMGIFLVATSVIALFGRTLAHQKQTIRLSAIAISGIILFAASLELALGKNDRWIQWCGIIIGSMAEIAFLSFILLAAHHAFISQTANRR